MLSLATTSPSTPTVAPARAAVAMQATDSFVRDMPGVTGPLGFFDPVGFTNDASISKIKWFREVEIKHGRVAMLAALGFLVGEAFHPMWGGEIDVPSYLAFQETPLNDFLPLVGAVIGIHEVLSIFTFNSPFGGELFSIRTDYRNGDLGWDPLGLKPTDPAAYKEMCSKEINNGRLAMIGIIGMIGQEMANGGKLF